MNPTCRRGARNSIGGQADDDGRIEHPDLIGAVADRMGMSRRDVWAHVDLLLAEGWLLRYGPTTWQLSCPVPVR